MRKLSALPSNNKIKQRLNPLKQLFFIALLLQPVIFTDRAECGQNFSEERSTEKSFLEQSIGLYQKFLSGADGGRCPMYPSCSAYAKQAFHSHGFLKGWILTSDRLLRCGHDELRLSGQQKIKGKYLTPDPLDRNDFLFK